VRIAPGRLKQIVLNLVTNAHEASPRGASVEIELRRVTPTAERARELDLSQRPHVEVAVRDAGSGMSEEVRRRAFDPFFSTKPPERGSGLGLASAYGIARRCGGTLALESALGRGTVARLFLPDAEQPLPTAPEPAPRDVPVARSARIWIVEDDERIRRLLQEALERVGHRARALPDGASALALLETEPPPELLVSDVVMPGMRGTELAARLRERFSQLRVLFLSGYSDVEIGDRRSGEKGVRFLAKPVGISDLMDAVAALLRE
jgi:CheY-like chemotaxis protein